MISGRILCTLLLAMVGTQSVLAQAGADSLDARIRDHATAHDFNGVVLVRCKGEDIYRGSFGIADRAFNVRVSDGTKFRIASITKLFTATLVLQLLEQGKLALDAPIRTYLSDYRGEGAERVTVHQLLNHTSGIQNSDIVGSYEEAVRDGIPMYQLPRTSDALLAKYASGKLVREVGKSFEYNNADYIILGKIVERLTGGSFEDALKRRILAPLAMTDSGMLHQKDIITGLAMTYFRPDGSSSLVNDLPVYMENWYAAGGMYADADDLATFAEALYGHRLLKPETVALMLKPGLDEYGYGLWVRDIDARGKTRTIAQRPGSIMGANTLLMRVIEDGTTIVILGNTNMTDIDAFGYLIARHVAERNMVGAESSVPD